MEGTLYIKRVAIKDFLTYQDFCVESTAGAGLSKGCNLILGKNGSGKSSFLNAVQFVLSDKYSANSKQAKRAMLNNIAQQASLSHQRQRAGSRPQNAPSGPSGAAAQRHQANEAHTYWVEVTLDNSLQRIPIRSSEVTVRKSYDCDTDKEEFHLNGQLIASKDLANLFESAGFSLSSSTQF